MLVPQGAVQNSDSPYAKSEFFPRGHLQYINSKYYIQSLVLEGGAVGKQEIWPVDFSNLPSLYK